MIDIEAPGYFRELKAEGYAIYILQNNDHILDIDPDAPGMYPDGHAHRPLCAHRARNQYQQEVASAAHRRLPA